jgi:tetratricopeptide (TPR) repeat protein
MPSRRKRLTKREIKHDPVIENALAAWSYVLHNKNRVVGVGLSVIILIIVVVGVTSYRSTKAHDAETVLSRSLIQLNSEEREVGIALLEELGEQRSGTPAGKRAVYYLAQVRFEDGRFAEAKELFERYSGHRSGDRFLTASAAKGVADCLVELGQLNEAGISYLDAAKRFPDTPLTADCLYLAGLALSEAKDHTGAKEALEQLIQNYSEYSRIGDARVLLGELRAMDLVIEQGTQSEAAG